MKLCGCFLLALILLGILLIGLGVGNPRSAVLMIATTDDSQNAHSMSVLRFALKHGGSVRIVLDALRSEFLDFERKYALLDSGGKYLVNGTIINFVVDHGWTYKAELLRTMVFTRTPFLYRILPTSIRRATPPSALERYLELRDSLD